MHTSKCKDWKVGFHGIRGAGYHRPFRFLQGFSSREITKLKEVYRRFDLDRRRQKDGVDSMTLCICGGRNNQGKMGAVDMFGETHGVDMC